MTLGHSTTWWGIWDEPYTYGENFYAAAPDVETAAKDLVTGNTFAKIEDDPEPDIDVGELEKSLKPKPVVDYWSGWSTKPWAPGVIFNETGDIYGSYSSGYAGGGYVGQRQPGPNDCPHCFRIRHAGPLRQRVLGMLDSHEFDPEYRAEDDDSPILCVGSDTYGPARFEAMERGYGGGNLYTVPSLQMLKKAMYMWPKWEIADPAAFDVKSWFVNEEQENETI